METPTGGVTMTPNVASTVSGRSMGSSEAGPKVNHVSHDSNEVSAPEKLEKIEEVHEDGHNDHEKDHNNIIDFTEYLTKKAKVDGVDAAFEELASTQEEVHEEPTRGESRVRMDKKPDDVNERIEEATDQPKEEEKIPEEKEEQIAEGLMVKILELQEKVVTMAESNEKLMSKMAEMTEMNHKAMMSAMELFLKLQELLEEEKDKEKKTAIEIMLKMWAQIMTYMMGGEKAVKAMDGEEDEEDKTPLEQMIAA